MLQKGGLNHLHSFHIGTGPVSTHHRLMRSLSPRFSLRFQAQSELVEKIPAGVFRVSGELWSAVGLSPINKGECRTVRMGFLASGDLCSKSAIRLLAVGGRSSVKNSGFSSQGSFTNLATHVPPQLVNHLKEADFPLSSKPSACSNL